VEEEDNDLACPECGTERDQIGTDPADMIHICPKCDEEPEEVEDALTSEDLIEALNEDDTPSIASLFGATDDGDDGDD
jgi:peptide subunit release factor 1 (eRF1)